MVYQNGIILTTISRACHHFAFVHYRFYLLYVNHAVLYGSDGVGDVYVYALKKPCGRIRQMLEKRDQRVMQQDRGVITKIVNHTSMMDLNRFVYTMMQKGRMNHKA